MTLLTQSVSIFCKYFIPSEELPVGDLTKTLTYNKNIPQFAKIKNMNFSHGLLTTLSIFCIYFTLVVFTFPLYLFLSRSFIIHDIVIHGHTINYSLSCAQGTYQLEIISNQSRAQVFLIDKCPA